MKLLFNGCSFTSGDLVSWQGRMTQQDWISPQNSHPNRSAVQQQALLIAERVNEIL
jgi:hypothetical protein